MKRYSMLLTVVVMAVTALAMAPALWAAEYGTKASQDETNTEQSAGRMQQGQSEATGGQMQSRHAGSDYSKRFHSSVRGSQLIGREVVNRNDEELGEVEDIVIGRDGRVNYLVVSHGGILGMGDNLIPVPFSMVDREDGGEARIILNVSREELENAPNFAQNQWPDFSDESYEQNVRGYFGHEPRGTETGMETKGARELESYEKQPGTQMQEEGQSGSSTTN